jgi:hypothetical protein
VVCWIRNKGSPGPALGTCCYGHEQVVSAGLSMLQRRVVAGTSESVLLTGRKAFFFVFIVNPSQKKLAWFRLFFSKRFEVS